MALGLKNYQKYGPALTSRDLWKSLAILWMVIDHIGMYFFPEELWWRTIGRLSAPIWFFFAGYSSPSKRYPIELFFLCGLLTVSKWWLGYSALPINILATILMCRAFIHLIEVYFHKQPEWTVYLLLAIWYLPTTLLFEYGSVALIVAYAGYCVRLHPRKPQTFIAMALAFFTYTLIEGHAIGYSPVQFVVITSGVALELWSLWHFQAKRFATGNTQHLTAPLRYIGRNTQYIYVLHVMLFMWLADPSAIAQHQ